jgi:hypothetical protein
MRNILSHRSTPSRQVYRGGAHEGNSVWGEILIDEITTVSRRRWLANNLSDADSNLLCDLLFIHD